MKQKLRPIPIHIRDAIGKELDNLEAQGVIEKVNGPTTWIASIVPVVKKRATANSPIEIRICTDSRDANRAVIRERYQMPTINDMITKMSGAKVFSKFDMRKAYYQMQLDKKSRYITAFNTPKGIYQWCVLNMGLSASSEIFQKAIEEILADIPGQLSLSDDLIVFGETDEKHEAAVIKVMERLSTNGITLNADKCEFAKDEIDFFGFHFSAKGVSLTEDKYRALKDAPFPKDAKTLRSVLGLAGYCERAAIPNFAKVVQPLRQLTKRKVAYLVTDEHRKAFEEFKDAVIKYGCSYYRKDWVSRIIVDASPKGLGLIHTQYNPANPDEKVIIEFKSRTLTTTEAKYSQTELEALAVVWAVDKLHFWLFNTDFEVVTDNKAVELIYGRDNSVQKGRIQRWGLRLMGYRIKRREQHCRLFV